MNFNFVGKDSVITEEVKSRVEEKLSKLDRYLPDSTTANVRCIVNRNQNRIEVTIPIGKRVLRGEVVADDMRSAIDKVLEILERQLISYKGRLKGRYRKEPKYKEEFDTLNISEDTLSKEELPEIERIKRFMVKPMHPEDAVMEMELLGHSFFVFMNFENDDINVIYKRKNGSYGLIEPSY